MHPIRLTLKNYRCFSHESPTRIELRPGFTALVGPNNAGKSTALKFIHELSAIWQGLMQPTEELRQALRKAPQSFQYRDIIDDEELFCNGNEHDLEFKIELLELNLSAFSGAPSPVISVTGSTRKRDRNQWRFTFAHGNNATEIYAPAPPYQDPSMEQQSNQFFISVNGVQFDYSLLSSALRQLASSLFIPAFRNAINQGSGEYYGMTVGSSFVEQWRNWKTGLNKTQARKIEEVTEDIRSIFGFSSLEINASDQHKTLAISIDRKPYRLAELGSGLAQFILIFGNAAIKQPALILIDEPETNLHPALQEAFVTALSKYADGNVVFATHSIGLARATAESIYSFRRESKGYPSVRIFEATRNYAEFVGEMSFSAYNELGCEAILLVEGVSDIKTVQQFLRILKQDARVVVIHLGGDQMVRGGVELELQELTRISKRVFALVDSEKEGANEPAHDKRVAFKKSCEALKIRAHLTERHAIENYFTNDAVRSALGDDHSALGEYETLKGRAQGWSKTRDNWRIANRMRKVDLENTDIGKFLLPIVGP